MDLIVLAFLAVGLFLGFGLGYLYFKSSQSSRLPESEELKIQLKLELERSAKLADDLQALRAVPR